MKTQAHLVVTAEALVDFARDTLLSDDPGRAYRTLTTALVGDGASDAAIGILRGEKDLSGDSDVGMGLVAAKRGIRLERFKNSARYIYAGRFKHHGIWMRPKAVIVQYGPTDAYAAAEAAQAHGQPWSDRARSLYYTRIGEHLELLELGGAQDLPRIQHYVVFERCGERPFWEQPPTTPQQALDEAIAAGRKLDERGFAVDDPSLLRARLKIEEERVVRQEKKRMGDRVAAAMLGIEDDDNGDAADTTGQEDPRAARDRRADERHEKWLAELRAIGEEVRRRAGDDTFVLKVYDGREFVVPRAPFVRWALDRNDELAEFMPAWENVAKSGVKMQLDNPNHTDWVLGAGMDIEVAYSPKVSAAAWQEAARVQEECREKRAAETAPASPPRFGRIFAAIDRLRGSRHPAAVIIDAGECTGVVGREILVLPDSDASQLERVAKCKGLIVAHGGPLAHLVIASRGYGITVMQHAEACSLFTEGMTLSLSPASGRIVVLCEKGSTT